MKIVPELKVFLFCTLFLVVPQSLAQRGLQSQAPALGSGLGSLKAYAQLGNSSKSQLKAEKPLPLSQSFMVLQNCFPELAVERLQSKVDLQLLKEISDEKYVTAQTLLEKRRIAYQDNEGRSMILTLRNIQNQRQRYPRSEVQLQQKDAKGVLTEYALTKNQQKMPAQDLINGFLLNSVVQEDEYHFVDTKLNGVKAQYRRLGKVLQEYSISQLRPARSLSCEARPELGIICTCSKK